MNLFDDDVLSDRIMDEYGVPPEAVEEIYGISNPYDEAMESWESEMEYRLYEEKMWRETQEDFFNHVLEQTLHAIREIYGKYPTISMLRGYEEAVKQIIDSDYRVVREELEPYQEIESIDLNNSKSCFNNEDEDDVPF